MNISDYNNFSKYNELIHIFEGKQMKTHLHVGYSAVGLLLSPVLQSAGHRQEVLLQLLGRDGLWASFISGGLYRYISYPSSGRAIGAPVLGPVRRYTQKLFK